MLRQLAQQCQEPVGPASIGVGDFREAGAVGLVDDDHVVLRIAAQEVVGVLA